MKNLAIFLLFLALFQHSKTAENGIIDEFDKITLIGVFKEYYRNNDEDYVNTVTAMKKYLANRYPGKYWLLSIGKLNEIAQDMHYWIWFTYDKRVFRLHYVDQARLAKDYCPK